MRPGSGCGTRSPHLRPHERAGVSARGRVARSGEAIMSRIGDIGAFNAVREAGMAKLLPPVPRIAVGMGTCGRGNGSEGVYHALASIIDRDGLDIRLSATGCFGACSEEPLVNVWIPGQPLVILRRIQASDAQRILNDLDNGRIPADLAWGKIEDW